MIDLVIPLFGFLFSTPLSALAVIGSAAAIPIIIHLLNRKRYVIINWAAMRFLLSAQKKNVRRLKLEQWILLAIRIILAILIALAMISVMGWIEPLWAKLFPEATQSNVSYGRVHRIIVLDGGFNMATQLNGNQTRFEAAKIQARAILDKSSPGDGFSLIFMSNPVQTIIPGPGDDPAKVKEEIQNLQLPHGSVDLVGTFNSIAEIVNRPLGKYNRREVYFLTDLKKSSWPLPATPTTPMATLEPISNSSSLVDTWQRIWSSSRVIFVDLGQEDVDNLAVTHLELGEPLPLIDVSTTLSAQIHNYGKRDRAQVRVEFLMGQLGRERLLLNTIEQRLVDIPAGGNLTVNFALERQNRFRQPGDYVLQVRIEPDSLSLDDQRSLAVSVRDSVPVMLVNGKPSPEPLDRASEWLSRALYPFPEGEKIPGYPARPKTLNTAQFSDAGLGDLSKVDCVFLCDVPRLNGNEVARLETHLHRGGSVVIGLGPNASKNLDAYNRLLFNEGKGILPGRLVGVKRAEGDHYFALSAEEEAFKQPPLAEFRGENERAGLTLPRFKEYIRLEAPTNGPARRLFSYIPSTNEPADTNAKLPDGTASLLDPAVVEWPRYRGRVIVFTSTLNTDWNNWPLSPTFPPFMQELLRFAVVGGSKQTIQTGEPILVYCPNSFAGLNAGISRITREEEIDVEAVPVVSQDDAGLIRYSNTDQSGIYRVTVGKERSASLFAVNVPVTAQGGGPESDLRRIPSSDIQASAPEGDIQIVTDIRQVQNRRRDGTNDPNSNLVESPDPRGPAIARVVLLIVLGLLALELILAWKLGSARAGTTSDPATTPKRSLSWTTLLWGIPVVGCTLVLGIVLHAMITGEFLGFLPDDQRTSIERSFGVPQAAPGEGTRWRLEMMPYLTGESDTDSWLTTGLVILATILVIGIYPRERIPSLANRRFGGVLASLGTLRMGLFLLTLLVLLPQLRLAFEREGWPDLAIVFDDSRSMSTVDRFRDSLIRDRANELRKTWAKMAEPRIKKAQERINQIQQQLNQNPSQEQITKLNEELSHLVVKVQDLQKPHRLNLIKALLASSEKDWLKTFLQDRRMRLHLFRASSQATRIAEITDSEQCERMLEEIIDIIPTGESSQLGNSVTSILKSFRGGSLNGVIMFTDGVTTKGEDLTSASRLAARMNVPLYFVGVGDSVEPPDLILRDLMAADYINVNDRLVFDTRVQWQGQGAPDTVPVILSEIKNGKAIELARETVKVDPNGQPVKVRLVTTPTEPGEKTYIVETPIQKDEVEPTNNRQERQVFVAEEKRTRVLIIEGYPRYEFRYLKNLFERETEKLKGNKSIDMRLLLLSAHQDFHTQDKSAIQYFPNLEELQKYDVVILGDVDPKLLPKRESSLSVLADFVKQRGGGLLILAGQQFSPHLYKDTALADLLPITWEGLAETPKNIDENSIQGYHLKLTPAGQSHPMFRFVGDEADNTEIWNRLMPMFWYAKNYRRKLSAEVLAVHPEKVTEPGPSNNKEENHPLILQQFVGAGRVMFFGFDETWRWRFRQDEARFNQFWIQTIRSLARSRVGRIEVRLNRQSSYRRDEPIQVIVRFPDDAPPPNPDTPIRVLVERTPLKQNGKTDNSEPEIQTLQLSPREGARATFETSLTRTPEGEYKFTLVSPNVSGTKPKAETRVLPPPGEMDRIQLNEPDMQRGSRESHGQYYPFHRAQQLPDELPEGPRVALDQPCPPISLWNHWLMFLLVFSMLTAEWVFRKRWRLL